MEPNAAMGLPGYGRAAGSYRSQPDESPGRAGHRAGGVGGPGRPDGLLHGARPPALRAGSQETCEGSSSLSERPAMVADCENTKTTDKERLSGSLVNI